jgi:hypothetical protein
LAHGPEGGTQFEATWGKGSKENLWAQYKRAGWKELHNFQFLLNNIIMAINDRTMLWEVHVARIGEKKFVNDYSRKIWIKI